MEKLIGREEEIRELKRCYQSDSSQFVAIYGRRRVGKTFLVDEVFKNLITFRHAGLSPIEQDTKKNALDKQLAHFHYSLMTQGMEECKCPKSWLEAFFLLEKFLQSKDDGKTRQVVFIDELPWMDTARSGFITGLEAFWNGWACHRDNLMLVVCGSATSWISDKLINNHGGLYGRLTCEIKLSPFSLKECELFFQKKNIRLSRYDIVQCYMALGGIPYYLNYFEKGLSLAQNIDNLFFKKGAKLKEEFDRLFASVFSAPEEIKKIIILLSSRHSGFTLKEISVATGIAQNGALSKLMKALVSSEFVLPYTPFGKSRREVRYKLVDPFCVFYLRYVPSNKNYNTAFWHENQNTQAVVSWRGYAFEEVCLQHIAQIKAALGVQGVASQQSSWVVDGGEKEDGAQIDLLINRADRIINLCEMKFYNDEFAVDKAYFMKMNRRVNLLLDHIPRNTAIHTTLITTFGLAYNEYSGVFQKVVTLDDLFN